MNVGNSSVDVRNVMTDVGNWMCDVCFPQVHSGSGKLATFIQK